MEFPSKTLENAVEAFSKFPGIGRKTATRLVLHLLKQNTEVVQSLEIALNKLRTDIMYCKRCGNISDTPLCSICSDTRRDSSLVCVVEDIRDVIAIENTGHYRGSYHVLGGLIAPLEGRGPDKINLHSLLERVKEEGITEILIALSTNMEGETTSFYISRQLQGFPVKISTLSRGIAVGGELEYADELTLARSIQNRVPLS